LLFLSPYDILSLSSLFLFYLPRFLPLWFIAPFSLLLNLTFTCPLDACVVCGLERACTSHFSLSVFRELASEAAD